MVEEYFDFEAEMTSFTDIFNRDILGLQPNPNLANHPTPIIFPDSTIPRKPETVTSLPLLTCTNNSIPLNPNHTWEMQGGKFTIPTTPLSSSDIQEDCQTSLPGILFGFQPLTFNDASKTLAMPQFAYALRRKLEAVDNLIRILFSYRNEVTEGETNSCSILSEVMRCIELFLGVHEDLRDNKIKITNQIRAMKEQTQISKAIFAEAQQTRTKYIDGVPITFGLWGQAVSQFDPKNMKLAGRILLNGIFQDELKTCTMRTRPNKKTGVTSTALDSIKLDVIYKILAWWNFYGCGGDSWGPYNPKIPFNPVLDAKQKIELRDYFVQQLNQIKQKERKAKLKTQK